MEATGTGRRLPELCFTIGLVRRAATAESHDDGGEGQASLHAVLPDALQDVERKVDVQVAQEHDAVAVLLEGKNQDPEEPVQDLW